METKRNSLKRIPRLELSYAAQIHRDALRLVEQAQKRRFGWLRRSL